MKNIKLFEQFQGIEYSLLESFVDKIETEFPEILKTAEVISPEDPPKENEIFIIWRKWLELQIKFGSIIGKLPEAKDRNSKEEMTKIESEIKSVVSESINWLNQKSSIDDIYKGGKAKNSKVVWLLYDLKEKVGGFDDFGIGSMYDLIKE